MLNNIALIRLNLWVNGEEQHESPADFDNILTLELAQLGFSLFDLNGDKPSRLSSQEFAERIEALKKMRGDDVPYVPLFRNFPDELPNDDIYLFQRILGVFGVNTFDSSQFGADPITQRQRLALWSEAANAQTQKLRDRRVEWIDLWVVSQEVAHKELTSWALKQLYSPTSIQETLWADIFTVIEALEIEPDYEKIVFKETLVRLAADQWVRLNKIVVKTPTDLLRLFAFLKQEDVSLAKPIDLTGLKLSKPQRHEIVRFLSECPSLEEDLLRYKSLWISLFKWIHPGDYAKKYPRVSKAFDDLRNKRIKSFQSQVDNALPDQKLKLLVQRPGVFLRQLTTLVKTVSEEAIATALSTLNAEQLPLPLLLSVYTALEYKGKRLVVTKGGKPQSLEPREAEVPIIANAVKSLILKKLQGTKDWKKVWLDPALENLVLPFQMRKQSEGMLPLARGSRISAGDSPVIRIFMYWHETESPTDLDLSVTMLDEEFENSGYVSFSQYDNKEGIAHSGDIQSAPYGATELVDLTKSSLKSAYILPSILHYGGEAFDELKAFHAGWMNREEVNAHTATFDPKTVVNKVDINQAGQIWIPFLYDVRANEIIFVDLYSKGSRLVEDNKHFPPQAEAIANYWHSKPTYGLLTRLYAKANDVEIVKSPELADTKIGITDECDINVLKLVGENVTTLLQ